jgi:hypothetical protein
VLHNVCVWSALVSCHVVDVVVVRAERKGPDCLLPLVAASFALARSAVSFALDSSMLKELFVVSVSRQWNSKAGVVCVVVLTYTVRYWMGRVILGSTSRRERTLWMLIDPLDRVRPRPGRADGRAGSSSSFQRRPWRLLSSGSSMVVDGWWQRRLVYSWDQELRERFTKAKRTPRYWE